MIDALNNRDREAGMTTEQRRQRARRLVISAAGTVAAASTVVAIAVASHPSDPEVIPVHTGVTTGQRLQQTSQEMEFIGEHLASLTEGQEAPGDPTNP